MLHSERKQAIARLAATLVEPDDTIVIDVGTTALEVARALPPEFRGRVLTNSVPAAMALADRAGIELHCAAGRCGTATRPATAPRRRPSSPSSTRTRRSSAPAACTPTPGSRTTTRPR
ncbi:MAG: hypothetical protein JO037_26015 [Actinobacteria bacterium]|nr:hypothetical protein [Actinomycetota bacterium]